MRQVVVRYKVRPEHAESNEELVRAVYDELAQVQPAGFRYMTFRLDDDVSFVHVAFWDGEGPAPLASLDAFKAFQEGIAERCDEPPVASDASLVGSYDGLAPAVA